MSHTPGPWKWIGGVLFGPTIGDDPNAVLWTEEYFDDDGDFERASVEVSEANAELIASAPKLKADRDALLEALKAVLPYAEMQIGRSYTGQPLCENAHAAIAQAEGAA